jgi:hypothetical protein
MWFEIFFGLYEMLVYITLCLRYLMSLISSHPKKVVLASNLCAVLFCSLNLIEEQRLSAEASATLKKYQETVAADRAVELAMAEKSLETFNSADSDRFAALVILLLTLGFFAFMMSRTDLSDSPSSEIKKSSVESPINERSTASAEPQVGEGLESTLIETITTISDGLSENLTQDFSALVSETLANSAPGLFSTILGLWISIVPYLLRAWG